jgi:hypothetical protein
MSTTGPPPQLRWAIARDLHPVRPLARPWQRALALAPIALVVVIGIPLLLGWRADLAVLGLGWSWGVSLFQFTVGMALIGAGLREAVPGRASSPAMLTIRLLGAVALVVAVSLATNVVSPTVVTSSQRVPYLRACLLVSATAGVPLLAAALLATARAFPLRPGIVGLFCGLGAGLATDAGWRLFCEVSQPSHVLLAHGGAIVAQALEGAAILSLVAWLRRRRHARA